MIHMVQAFFGVSLDTANWIALLGLLLLGGGCVVGLMAHHQVWAIGLLSLGGGCFLYYILHAIFDSLELFHQRVRQGPPLDQRQVVQAANTWLQREGRDAAAWHRNRQALRELMVQLETLKEYEILGQVLKRASEGFQKPSIPIRLNTAKWFQSLHLSALLDRTQSRTLHRELSHTFLSAIHQETDSKVYDALAELSEDLVRWSMGNRVNQSTALAIIQEFRRQELEKEVGFPSRARQAYAALRRLSDKEILGYLAQMLRSEQSNLRETAYVLAQALVGQWVRRLPKWYFRKLLLKHRDALGDRLLKELEGSRPARQGEARQGRP